MSTHTATILWKNSRPDFLSRPSSSSRGNTSGIEKFTTASALEFVAAINKHGIHAKHLQIPARDHSTTVKLFSERHFVPFGSDLLR
jgi:hypothetical protein